ncbi:MAG: hypothetical protein AAF211_29440, partial [Myxococcota bacterium]
MGVVVIAELFGRVAVAFVELDRRPFGQRTMNRVPVHRNREHRGLISAGFADLGTSERPMEVIASHRIYVAAAVVERRDRV